MKGRQILIASALLFVLLVLLGVFFTKNSVSDHVLQIFITQYGKQYASKTLATIPENWKTYSDDSGWSVQYPSDITPAASNYRLPTVTFARNTGEKHVALDVSVNSEDPGCLSPIGLANRKDITNIGTTSIQGVDYFSFFENQDNFNLRVYRTVHDGTCIILTRTDQSVDTSDVNVAEFNSMLSTFRFTK